ncbi:MAG: hypothetical protein M9951_03250 [Burkholderiaceae bacterium]|jgi:hypothetical protein|nr:hypothetical protein [Burkholderiaceae bacterium]MEB2317745.1 hypothetical protein [Pseudomonadota bacterium]
MAHFHHPSSSRALLPWILALFTGAAFAQAPADTEASPPSLPTKLSYSPAISAYQTYEDQQGQSWREANDRVGQIGGWRAYAKEIKTGKPASVKDVAPASDQRVGDHGGGTP